MKNPVFFCTALLAIILADITDGVMGLLVSTGLIVLLGEIAPQAVCSRHGLWIGARTIWLTKAVIVILFPLAYPVSKLLDKVSRFYPKSDIITDQARLSSCEQVSPYDTRKLYVDLHLLIRIDVK